MSDSPNECQGKGKKDEFVKENDVVLCVHDVHGRGQVGRT
jgi:hypothetical protein